jgi:hypothetical protein
VDQSLLLLIILITIIITVQSSTQSLTGTSARFQPATMILRGATLWLTWRARRSEAALAPLLCVFV